MLNSAIARPSGWRKQTPDRAYFSDLAAKAPIGDHGRAEIRQLLNRIRPVLRTNTTQMLLLNILFDATYEQDWQQGSQPIVWLSNDALARQLNISVSATRAALRALTDMGVITHHDSANCRRFGHRDRSGRIVHAHGISLALLEARFGELTAKADKLDLENHRRRVLRNDITSLRRNIMATLEIAKETVKPSRWHSIAQRFDQLRAFLGKIGRASVEHLERMHRDFERLWKALNALVMRDLDKKTDTKASSDGHLLEHTTQPETVSCNEERSRANAQHSGFQADSAFSAEKMALENEPRQVEGHEQPEESVKSGRRIDLRTVLAACPIISELSAEPPRSWRELDAYAAELRPMFGVSAHAWAEMRQVAGQGLAALALAITAQKYADGEVSSPGGYLRGMARKAAEGELHLEKSLHGLLARKLAARPDQSRQELFQ
ncbi:winged helix-turn-helix transcriptional regulator [Martelella mediterranea]|uniref:plasmid replication protein RepC n=1 Tax=Martelella mediterranea TaxID=293089 RepID=UPI001E64454B|nr:plasmid replication protein RepC [Martelella mediterranea]MCD1635905.1 winged helix-turn-helix transcriptional regulator [Martelella mediterranea]